MPRFKIPFGVKIFCAIWLVVFLTPPLHEVFQAASYSQSQLSYFPLYHEKKPDLRELLRHHPNDPNIIVTRLPIAGPVPSSVKSSRSPIEARADAYDNLIRRFPGENWIRAARLNRVMNRTIEVNAMGWTESANKINPATLPGSIKVASDAQKIEPDNAFFPWMEAIAHFGLGQKEAGLTALQKAAKAKRFDNYQEDLTRRRLAVYKLAAPLIYEEKVMVLGADSTSYFEQVHKVQDAAVHMAIDAYRQGKHQRALEICDAILAAAAVIRNHGGTFRHAILGGGLERDTLENMNKALGFKTLNMAGGPSGERSDYLITLSQDFATYAKQHDRGDLANRVLHQAAHGKSIFLFHQRDDWWQKYWLASPRTRLLNQALWFSPRIYNLAIIGAAIWLVITILAFIWQWRTSKDEYFAQPMPTRGEVAFTSAFSFWSILSFGVLAVMFGVGVEWPELRWLKGLNYATLEQGRLLLTQFLPLCTFICWLLPIAFTTWKRLGGSPLQWFGRVLTLLALFQWTLLYCIESGLLPVVPTTWVTSAPLAGTLALGAIGIQTYFAVQALATWRSGRASPTKNERIRFHLHWLFAARLAGTSAGVLAVSFSLLFLALNLRLWPERANLNRVLERRIQLGEEGWLREQVAQQKRSSNKPRD